MPSSGWIAKDEDNGEALRRRSEAYNPLTRAYLKALGITEFPSGAAPSDETMRETTDD